MKGTRVAQLVEHLKPALQSLAFAGRMSVRLPLITERSLVQIQARVPSTFLTQ
jgi:hypothetical protein